jgi:hypothetical protein
VLVDLEHRRFYFFFIEIWPQEIYYLTGLLIVAAVTLFLMNAVAGRLWCGYLCPQTVWTDLFFAVERLIEGDRRERMKKAGEKWNLETFAQSMLKHWAWLMIAWWTGGAWVLYFADAPTLVYELATFQAPAIAYIWIAILTFTTYFFAGYVAAHPGGPDGRMGSQRHLSLRPRRTARLPEKSWGAARGGCARRRLRGLQPVLRCLSDGRRHSRWPADRLHPVRPVHRRLRHRHDQGRTSHRPDRLRHRHQRQAP